MCSFYHYTYKCYNHGYFKKNPKKKKRVKLPFQYFVYFHFEIFYNPKLLQKLSKDNFTLRIIYLQFENTLKIGTISLVAILFSFFIDLFFYLISNFCYSWYWYAIIYCLAPLHYGKINVNIIVKLFLLLKQI